MNEANLRSRPSPPVLSSLANCSFCSWSIYPRWTQRGPGWGAEVVKAGVTPSIFLGSPACTIIWRTFPAVPQSPCETSVKSVTYMSPLLLSSAPDLPCVFSLWSCVGCHASFSRICEYNELCFFPEPLLCLFLGPHLTDCLLEYINHVASQQNTLGLVLRNRWKVQLSAKF